MNMLLSVILKRDIGAQFEISRNLQESRWTKCRRAFWACLYLVKAFGIATRGMFREQLMSRVIYRGRTCYVLDWAGSRTPTLGGSDGFRETGCPRAEIKNVIDFDEIRFRFKSSLNHYMSSWYSIDIQNRLYR